MNIFKKKAVKIQSVIEPSFEFGDHKFYVLNPRSDSSDPLYLPTERALAYTLALCTLERRIKDDELMQQKDSIKTILNSESKPEKKLAELAVINEMFEVRLSIGADEDIYINMGKAVIIIDDEDPKKPERKYHELKDKLLKEPIVRSFFLHTGVVILAKYSQNIPTSTSISSTENYLKGQKVREITLIWRKLINPGHWIDKLKI